MGWARPAALIIVLALVAAAAYIAYLGHSHVAATVSTASTAPAHSSTPGTASTTPMVSNAAGQGGSVLRIALGDWGPPSPFLFYPRGPGYVLTSLVFDTLVWKDSKGVVPWLAESWEEKDNGTTWIFHLRHGVRWQDGKPLTARDVVFTFKYLLEKGWSWKNIKPSLIESVEARGNYTVVIKLRRPYPFFLEDYASTVFILPEHIWRNITNPYSYRGRGAFIGSGPYMLKEYRPQEGYVFEANPRFWLGKPIYKEIRVIAMGFNNPQAVANALLEGEVDTAAFMGKAYRLVKMIRERMPDARIQEGPMYWVLFLGFNLAKEPYNETLFRRAVAYALNLTDLVLRATGSLEAAVPGAPGYIPPYSPFYNPHVPRYPYSPAKARQLLDRLGIRDTNGDGCRELHGKPWHPILVAPTWYTQEASIVAEQLRRVGICVQVKTVKSFNQLDTIVHSGGYDMVINGHGADGNTPTSFAWFFSGRFAARWSNETYWSLVRKLLEAPTRTEAYTIAKKLQEVIASQLPRIALYYPNIFVVTRPGVKAHWFFTWGGIDGGIPLPYNKLALIETKTGQQR